MTLRPDAPQIVSSIVGRVFSRMSRTILLAFTLIELLIVMALLSTLTAIVVPLYLDYMNDIRVMKARMQLMTLAEAIDDYDQIHGCFPASLDELGEKVPRTDPWGSPYQYLRIRGSSRVLGKSDRSKAPTGARKDHWMVPLNLDYDLYSKGKDRQSQAPLTAPVSHDDVIRAMEGGYFGLASEY
jgi:general secretion pathway protein G